VLEPLTVGHAAEMVEVLSDASLYAFTGGEPPTVEELTRRYGFQSVGHSPDGTQDWLNWIVRRTDTGAAVGYVQATVGCEGAEDISPAVVADLAWVVAPAHQRNGFAVEASGAVRDWLIAAGVPHHVAHIHPDNAASTAVARSLGMWATDAVVDGETRWERTARV
jgi:RimJ/RimL family protein N-acetyltransferase